MSLAHRVLQEPLVGHESCRMFVTSCDPTGSLHKMLSCAHSLAWENLVSLNTYRAGMSGHCDVLL